ncbi:hypothetical protein [Vitiosangium sp. GDMCC 1.1324]|uniref:hypothetical protein n=1 Tax=Vitiosangium sp. (strain GDMCC 1.1324) TaxID=2138576 RepID=UPI000D36F290|nr:hypothetical protein [Vitiosangium sp. GDMCC 1.1324]PTL83047.1 hypothetical protein DAT35_13595 [Vitiosangium sp. GDMCC 1.1324]
MADSMGSDIGQQVLKAVYELGAQVKNLSEQVKNLSEQVTGLTVRMDKLEARMDKQEEWLQRLGLELMETREDVKRLRAGLMAEIEQTRKDLRTELRVEIAAIRTDLQLGSRQVHDRIDRNSDAMLMMTSGLQRTTTARFDTMEQRLHVLEAR